MMSVDTAYLIESIEHHKSSSRTREFNAKLNILFLPTIPVGVTDNLEAGYVESYEHFCIVK